MIKAIVSFLLILLVSGQCAGQDDLVKLFKEAEDLVQKNDFQSAYRILKEIEPRCDKEDTLYNYIIWYYTGMTSQIEKGFRDKQQFDSSLYYGREALSLIEKGKPYFDERFASRAYFMTKNLVVSFFGLGLLDSAMHYKKILYQAWREKKLPEGMNEYFNFHFFKWEDKNVWGYEWFEDLPEDRFSKSFSKIVYYVYSTNPDGSDKEQLYRLHVLMFHNLDPSNGIDYVLTKRLETARNEVSGTLYAYTYKKDIDYKKLMADIREVLKGNYKPEATTTVPKN